MVVHISVLGKDALKILMVGGGVAGLSCALRLLKEGHAVTVAEKQRGPIDKVCGEGILPFGVALLEEMNVAREVRQAGKPFRGIVYCLNDREVSGGFPENLHGIGIDRKDLDRILREACAQFPGFAMNEGMRVKPNRTKGFDRIIAADGIHSGWARSMGYRPVFGKRLGLRFRLETPAEDRVAVHFFKGCEIYLTPTGDRSVSVAFLIDPDQLGIPGGALKDWCSSFFRDQFPRWRDLTFEDVATRGPISSRASKRPPDTHLLGDAYRAFDPISGAGMSFALLCGKLACAHLNNTRAYYDALRPAVRSIGDFTNTILFFRGGGLKTRLMLRQIGRAPRAFEKILSCHDGRRRITDLDAGNMIALLRPF